MIRSPRILVTACLIVQLASLARAEPRDAGKGDGKASAMSLSTQAAKAWEQGDYLAALDQFRKAYAEYPSANLHFNIARVLSDLGRDVEALESFEAFLAKAPNAPEQQRAVAQAKIAILEQRVGVLKVECATRDAQVSLDGKLLGKGPLTQTVRSMPGAHQVAALAPGFLSFVTRVTVEGGGSQLVSVKLLPLVAPARPVYKRWWLWTTLVGSAAVVAGAVALGMIYGQPRGPQPDFAVTLTPSASALTIHR